MSSNSARVFGRGGARLRFSTVVAFRECSRHPFEGPSDPASVSTPATPAFLMLTLRRRADPTDDRQFLHPRRSGILRSIQLHNAIEPLHATGKAVDNLGTLAPRPVPSSAPSRPGCPTDAPGTNRKSASVASAHTPL